MKKLLCLFLCIWALSSIASAEGFSAHCPTGQTLFYKINSGELTVTVSYDDTVGGTVVIPSTVYYHGTYWTVTRIEDNGFYNVPLMTSVTIPNTVTYIGGHAFENCGQLTTVNFNADSCTRMGDYPAFSGCTALTTLNIGENVKVIPADGFIGIGITSVTIPHNVQNIGNHAFDNCTQLTTVNFNADSCTYMGENIDNRAFAGCTALSTLNIGENVKNIPDYAFSNTRITSLTIGENVQSIGNEAFRYCTQLTSVTIPNSVTSIGYNAFYSTGITSVTIPHNVQSIGVEAFAHCTQLTSVNFNADSCTYMGDENFSAFSYCINTLNIGENVKNIPDYAFSRTVITSVTIPHNVKNIGYKAFGDCFLLTTVNFNADSCTNNGGTHNGSAAFALSGVTTLNIGDNVLQLPDRIFYECRNLATVNFGNSVRSIGRKAFAGCQALSTLELPASLERIGPSAFQYSHLTSIVIPQQVTVIDSSLFEYCNYLTSVVLPDSLEEIKYCAFNSCSALDSIIIPNSVSSIDSGAFLYCYELTHVVLPDSLAALPAYAFHGCSSLPSITIPSTVTQIGNYAFAECTSLQRITMLNPEPPTIAGNTFREVSTNVPIFVPCGATDSYTNADFWSHFINYNEDDSCFRTLSLNCNNAMMGTMMGVGRYSSNSNVTIAAIPYIGYQFLGWNDGDSTNPRTIQVFSDTTFTATFAAVAEPLALHNVTVMSSNASMGSAAGSGVYQEGCSLSIVALPNSGYAFSGWHDGNTDNPRTILVNSDGYYIASFISAPISSDTVLVHDTTYIDVHDTTVVHDTTFIPVHDTTIVHDTTFIHVHDTTIVHDTTFVPVHDTTIVHDTTFVPVHDTTIVHDTTFVTVYDTTIVHDTTIITVTDTIVQPITYYDLSVTSGNISQGLVAGNGHFPEGTMVEIAAIPMEGYRFKQWDDGNTDNPRVVEVSGDITFEASFDASTESIGNVDNQEYIITTDKGSITIQGAAHKRIRIFDCLGRLLTTEMNTAEYKTFMVPASGAYMVQIGDNPAKRVVVIR